MFQLKTLTDYSDESILAEIRRVASEFKGKRLTRQEFDKLSHVHSTTLANRFGSWWNALDRAGISVDAAPRPRRMTRELLLEEINAYVKEFGESPTDRPPSRVGSKAYVLRWGGWRAALAAFISYINQSPVSQEEDHAEPALVQPSANLSNPPPTSTSEPRTLGLALRYKVLCRDRFRCQICGRSPAKDIGVELHVDHVVPWSKGGQNTEENLRTLCFDCNLGKGAKNEKIL